MVKNKTTTLDGAKLTTPTARQLEELSPAGCDGGRCEVRVMVSGYGDGPWRCSLQFAHVCPCLFPMQVFSKKEAA